MGLLRWIVASGFRVALAIALLVGGYHLASELLALAGRPLSFLQRLELTALDVKFSFRSDRPPDDWQVAIAAVDERAIRRFGPLPWTRAVHAQVVDRLTELGAKAVAFDMTFEQPTASAAKDSADALELRSQNGALEKTQKTLDRSADDIDQVATRLRRMRRPRVLKRFAKGLPALRKRSAGRPVTSVRFGSIWRAQRRPRTPMCSSRGRYLGRVAWFSAWWGCRSVKFVTLGSPRPSRARPSSSWRPRRSAKSLHPVHPE